MTNRVTPNFARVTNRVTPARDVVTLRTTDHGPRTTNNGPRTTDKLMHRFTDSTGRDWLITINKRLVRKLWDLLRINLHDPADLGRLSNQERYLLLPQMLLVLCADQVDKIWPDLAGQFAAQLEAFDQLLEADEDFDTAHAAFCGELADFCRSRGRQAVAKYLDATPRLLAKERQANLAQLPDVARLEADLDARLPTTDKELTPGLSSTITPEKSVATEKS